MSFDKETQDLLTDLYYEFDIILNKLEQKPENCRDEIDKDLIKRTQRVVEFMADIKKGFKK